MEEWDEQKGEGRGNKSAQKGTDRADRVHKLPTEMRSPPLLPSPFHPLEGWKKIRPLLPDRSPTPSDSNLISCFSRVPDRTRY